MERSPPSLVDMQVKSSYLIIHIINTNKFIPTICPIQKMLIRPCIIVSGAISCHLTCARVIAQQLADEMLRSPGLKLLSQLSYS